MQTGVWNASLLQQIPQRGVVPTEGGVFGWQRHNNCIHIVERVHDRALNLRGGRPRADCVRAILIRERSDRIVATNDIASNRTTPPWADLRDDNGSAGFDRRVQNRSVHWRAGEKNTWADKRRAFGNLVCSGARQCRI